MQTLLIQTVWFAEADRAAAVELGLELYDMLTRPRSERLAFGPGIPVGVGASAQHVDLDAAQHLLIVPVLGARSFDDRATRERVIASVNAWHDRLGPRHVVPVFDAPVWRNKLAELRGKPMLGRILPGGGETWMPIVIDVALAACRLIGDSEHRPRIFVSHAKQDLAGTEQLAERLAEFIRRNTTGEAYFDHTDLEPGVSLRDQLALAAAGGVFVAVRGDSYASRPWCERELLDAKRASVPTLTVQVLQKGEQRSYPYSGNGPTLVWAPGTSLAPIVLRAIVEWLRARHFRLDAERFRGDIPTLVVLPRPPELLDLAQGPLLDRAPVVVMHPDPEVSRAERDVLREARPRMRLVTPSTLYRGLAPRSGAARCSTALLDRHQIALSLSDSPDVGGAAGFTADHVADATVFVARALVSAGAAIAYGGDQRFGGYDELLANLIVTYNASGQAQAELLISYQPATENPDAPGVPRSDVAFTRHSLRVTDGVRERARLPAPPDGTPSLVQRAVYLSDMRRVMAEDCFARIALGGQAAPQPDGTGAGYIGAYPGLVEEAWWTLEADRPLYIAGGFGGAAGALAELFDGNDPPAALQPATFAIAPEFSAYRERATAFASSPLRETVGAPRDLAALVDGLRAHAQRRLASNDTAVAWNGLTVDENRRLFRTRDQVAITQLVMRGLYRKALAAAEGQLRIELVRGNILQVEAVDAIAVAAFPHVPIGGAAEAIDRVMSSRMSAALHDGQSIIPVPSPEIDADWLMIGDLGAVVAGDPTQLPAAIERCAERVAELATRNTFHRIAVVSFGSSAHPDLDDVVTRMLRGFSALRGRCTLQWFERDRAVYEQLATRLAGDPGVSLTRLELVDLAPTVATAAAPAVRDVLVTTRYADAALYATIMPPDGAAVARWLSTPLSETAFLAIARPTDRAAPSALLDDAACEATVTALFGAAGRDLLRGLRGHRLVFQHDAQTAMLPFEQLTIDGHRYSLGSGVIRRPALSDVPLTTPRPVRRGALQLLLVVDPTLPGAVREAEAVERAVKSSNNVRLEKLVGDQASKDALLAGLRNPDYDVFHYCGHAFYSGPDPQHSGLLCPTREQLTAADIAAVDATPRIAFFNACSAARIRDLDESPLLPPNPALFDNPQYSRAFATYFLRGGVEAYLGTLWPVDDAAAAAFATSIYTELARGQPLEVAIRTARKALRDADRADWANYVLYGDGAFSIVR